MLNDLQIGCEYFFEVKLPVSFRNFTKELVIGKLIEKKFLEGTDKIQSIEIDRILNCYGIEKRGEEPELYRQVIPINRIMATGIVRIR